MRDLSLSRFADTILKQDESQEQEDGQFAQSSQPKKKQKNNSNSAMVNAALWCRWLLCTQSNTAP